MSSRPNILIMLPHDLGDFLGCMGHANVESPAIDRLAQRGVCFTNCFTTSPECTPSRGGLMTGLYPHQNGLMGLSNFGWSLRVPHLAAVLRDLGYDTHLFGFQHETHEAPETLGYRRVHSRERLRAGDVCSALRDFLETPRGEEAAPWFAYAGFHETHRRWVAARDSQVNPNDITVPEWLPDNPLVRTELSRFYQDIRNLDREVGTVLDTLEHGPAGKDTLVIFTTDHGAAFPGAKATLYDPGIHVPLILHWPGHIEGGARPDTLLSNLDLAPTLIELAGGTPAPSLAGRSFRPLLEGSAYRERDSVGGALFYDVAYDPMHYVRTRTHKYIRSFAVTPETAAGADPEVLSTFAAGRWVRVDDYDVLTSPTWQALAPPEGSPRPPEEELYDLSTDPRERINLAEDPAARVIMETMRERMRRMMEATDSPLLRGHVPPPEKQKEAFRGHLPGGAAFVREVQARKELL